MTKLTNLPKIYIKKWKNLKIDPDDKTDELALTNEKFQNWRIGPDKPSNVKTEELALIILKWQNWRNDPNIP